MTHTPEHHFANIERLKLVAYISKNYGSWSAAVYDRDKQEYVWEHEPLPPDQNSEDSAKREAVFRAAVILRKSPEELSPAWERSEPSPR